MRPITDPLPSPAPYAHLMPIEIRPVRPEDRTALQAGFDRLSERSRYRRFLSPHSRLTDSELRYLTEVDHHDHEALVAIDPATGEGIGIARYIRSRVDEHVAELAVAVADDWQRHGVGSELAAALADRAHDEGVTAFTASLFTDNTLMLSVIRHLGAVRDVRTEQGVIELTVDLPNAAVGQSLTCSAAPREARSSPALAPAVLSSRRR